MIMDDLITLATLALEEDIGTGDISAQLLDDFPTKGTIITREEGIYCGKLWVEALINAFNRRSHSPLSLSIQAHKKDGEWCQANDLLLSLQGNLHQLLSIERTLLNGLQLLCGVATKTHHFVCAIKGITCTILDTRKTIPGWRQAQKYAVRIGGGKNHRMGLYDAYLLKENHQMHTKSVAELVRTAKSQDNQAPICVEVENLDEFRHVLTLNPEQILLDNFNITQLTEAVKIKQQQQSSCQLEASGNIGLHNIRQVAETGVDYISIGALTKHIEAMDLSMRIAGA